ncbi:unnamed protein product, partial [marine sediment metagenome]
GCVNSLLMVRISFQGNTVVGLPALNLERVRGDETAAEMIALTDGNKNPDFGDWLRRPGFS